MGFDAYLIVAVASVGAAMISASMGMGGAVFLRTVLIYVVPIQALLGVQNACFVPSLFFRAALYRHSIDWKTVYPFAAGMALGAIAGAFIYAGLPENALRVIIALTMLHSAWADDDSKFFRFMRSSTWPVRMGIAAVSNFLLTVTGSSGLMAAVFQRLGLKKNVMIATMNTVALFGNLWRFGVYQHSGFDLTPYLGLVAISIPFSALGAYLGKRYVDDIPEVWFWRIYRGGITLIAGHQLWQVIEQYIA